MHAYHVIKHHPACILMLLLNYFQDIYIARAEGELVLEEELFHLLVSIYRQPSVLFYLTRKDKAA